MGGEASKQHKSLGVAAKQHAANALAAAPGVINQAAQVAAAARTAVPAFQAAMNMNNYGGVTGGCDCEGGYFGGDPDADPAKGLREYASSLSAKTKEDVIRRLATALNRAGIDVSPTASLETIVETLRKQIPDPKNNGRSFSSNLKDQETVCNTIATVLNAEFSPGATKPRDMFIDTSLGTVEICRTVSEWAHSFAVGVNTEFLAVHASVKNALRAIEILSEIMREIYGKIRAKAEKDGDSKFSREFDPLDEVYSRAQVERKKQEEFLKNILHVQLAPAAKELEMAMRDESEQNALIKRLSLTPGTSEFADSLASAISGLGSAASIAQRVHKALKQVGINVQQYLESKGFVDFKKLIDEKLFNRDNAKVNFEDMAKFIEATTVLRNFFNSRDEPRFREALEKSGGRRYGGDDEYRSTVDKRVERAKLEKSLIIRDFVGRISSHYDEILAAVKALGPELGRKIPLTDKTDALRDALVRLRDMRGARIELALIGLYSDASAREHKENFINSLSLVSSTCSVLMELEMFRGANSYLSRLKAAIDGLRQTVDFFSDMITKKYGGEGDTPDEDVQKLYEGGRASGARGGADDDLLPDISRSAISLNEAVSEFAYFYYVAKVRGNLEQSAKELDVFGENYVEVLGDAVAARLWNLRQERLAIERRIALRGAVFPNTPDGEAAFAAAKKWVEQEYDVKEKFYKALQAMDLYMKAFTVGIVKDPDAVRDIKKMLDGTQVIARWFSEDTGNFLWKAFDRMGSVNDAAARVDVAAMGRAVIDNNDQNQNHYYQKVAAAAGAGAATTLGIPQISIPAADAVGGAGVPADAVNRAALAKKSVADALEYFQALKNLVNAFARIGDRFGGRELRSQVFMSPTQIFKTLMDYLKQSAMSINAGTAVTPAADIVTTINDVSLPAAVNIANGVKPYEVYFGSVQETLVGNYMIEDRYFTLIVKSMAAKILTTLGVYDMFERHTPIYDLTPTRLIVGGAEDGDPEIIEGATELYFRLPRLVEFYRGFLRWDGGGTQQLKIAMLPELEGIFSGLIRLIFQKMASPESGDYSDSELRSVVREVNMIYTHFHEKTSERAVQAAMNAFIMEINRRFGVIKSDDMQKYWGLVRRVRRESEWGSVNGTNYAILPGEEETEVDHRAPSDRYTIPGSAGAPAAGLPREFAGRIQLDNDITDRTTARRMLLREFRTNIEKEFNQIPREQFGQTSFSLLIKQAEAEIRRASDNEAKLNIVTKLIQGTNTVSLDANKAFMFHETVVVGLNTVGAIDTLLQRFSEQIDLLNPVTIENAIMDALHRRAQTGNVDVNFDRNTLMGADYMNTPKYARYIHDGAGGAGGGLPAAGGNTAPLFLRSGLNQSVNANHLYWFWHLEGTYMHALADRQLPALPSSYTTEEQVRGLANDDLRRSLRALRYFARMVVDYNQIMRDLIETLFDLSAGSGGLIEVRFPQGASSPISINFSKLRTVAESLLGDVKHYIDAFRPFIPKSTISRFEDNANAGSVFWLEDHLVDQRFRGRTDEPTAQAQTLDGISRRTSQAFAALIRDTQVPVNPNATSAMHGNNDAVRAEILPVPADTNAHSRVESYGRALSEIVFYDATKDNRSAQPGLVRAGITDNFGLGNLITGPRGAGGGLTAIEASGGGNLERYGLYSTTIGMTLSRSLMFAFNQVLAHYLNTLTDPASNRKIYSNLINAYANGVAARSVAEPNGNSHPDLATAIAAEFGRRGDPKPQAVILQSLAYVLQRLAKDVNPTTQISDHLVTTLTDVPLYMKESYRVNLPGFIRLFDLIVQKCDFIKQLVQKTAINCARPNQMLISDGTANAANTVIQINNTSITTNYNNLPTRFTVKAIDGLHPLDGTVPALAGDAGRAAAITMQVGKTSEDMKVRIAEIADAISTGAYTLASSASEVLKELADQPIYLQTQDGSIETYKLRYGKLPLMPLSLSLYFLNDLSGVADAVDDLKLFPKVSFGEPQFKIQYGVRGLLIRQTPVEFETMPGIKASLDAYNGVSSQREQLDPARYLGFVKNVVATLRYITEARNYKSMISTSQAVFSYQTLLGNAIRAAGAADLGNASYAIAKSDQTLVTLVESSNQDEEMNKIVAVTGGSAGAGSSRRLERILNLVDMNVIPINVHALMRDIPLANLYNYEYTFEQMVAALYGESASRYIDPTDRNSITNENTVQTRQLFLRMLIDPYLNLDAGGGGVNQGRKLYGSDVMDLGTGGFVHRIFRGDNNLGLGRPKFLSDQLFNKALFGSTYQATEDFDEAGPGVGAGISRGRENVGHHASQAATALRSAQRAVQILTQLRDYMLGVAATAAAAAAGALDDAGPGDNAANNALAANDVPARAVAELRQAQNLLNTAHVIVDTIPAAGGAGGAGGAVVAELATILEAAPAVVGAHNAGVANAGSNLAQAILEAAAAAAANMRYVMDMLRNRAAAPFADPGAPGSVVRISRLLTGIGAPAAPANSLMAIANAFAAQQPLPAVAAAWQPQIGRRAQRISFLSAVPGTADRPETVVTEVDLGSVARKARLECIGRMRFDTRLVRNIFFITNVQRLVRLKLNRELTQSRSVLVSSHSAVAPGVTEYGADPFGPNEVLASTLPNGMDRYNDRDAY